MEPKLFGDLEPEPKINFKLTFSGVSLEDVIGQRKANFYLFKYSTTVIEQFLVAKYGCSLSWSRSQYYGQMWSRSRK